MTDRHMLPLVCYGSFLAELLSRRREPFKQRLPCSLVFFNKNFQHRQATFGMVEIPLSCVDWCLFILRITNEVHMSQHKIHILEPSFNRFSLATTKLFKWCINACGSDAFQYCGCIFC